MSRYGATVESHPGRVVVRGRTGMPLWHLDVSGALSARDVFELEGAAQANDVPLGELRSAADRSAGAGASHPRGGARQEAHAR